MKVLIINGYVSEFRGEKHPGTGKIGSCAIKNGIE